MPVSLTSPDTGNLYVGKGICSFKKDGEDDFRDLGNCPEVELTLNIETLEHFTSRAGTRSKDLIIVLERGGTLRFITEEWTPENLAMFFLGSTVDELAQGGPIFDILSEDAISGEFKFHGTNDQGPNYDIHLHNVRITPAGGLNLIGDDWGGIEVEAEILLSGSTDKFGTVQLTNLPSET